MEKQERKQLIITMSVRMMMWPLAIGLMVLLPAGTLDYWQAYVYTAVMLTPMLWMMFYFLKKDPEFLVRRMKSREKEKEQKLFQVLSLPIFILAFVLPGLDKRFGWSEVPVWLVIAANIVLFLGYLLVFRVFQQNSYAARTVEVEEDQTLISDGLYGLVRHPMYTGVILMFLPVSLALGSFWGLIPMAIFPFLLVLRIKNEEKVLTEGLQGYREYCDKVRYRLVPGIW